MRAHTHTHTEVFIRSWQNEDYVSLPVGVIVSVANGAIEGTEATGALVGVTIGTDVDEIGTGVVTGAGTMEVTGAGAMVVTGAGAMVVTGAGTMVVTGAGTMVVTGVEVCTGVGTGAVVKSNEVAPPSFFPDVAELLLKLGESLFLVPTIIPIITPTAMTRTIKTRRHNRTLYTFVESLHIPVSAFSSTAADWSVSLLSSDCFSSMLTSSLLISESIRDLSLLLGWLSVVQCLRKTKVLDGQ